MALPQFIVEGGRRLSGTITPTVNKNAALPIVCAALLTDQPVTLENVPRIRDIESLLQLVRQTGATAEWQGKEGNTLLVHAKAVRGDALAPELCKRIRASILLAAPLLARAGYAPGEWQAVVASFAASVLAGLALYLLVETPFMKLRERFAPAVAGRRSGFDGRTERA